MEQKTIEVVFKIEDEMDMTKELTIPELIQLFETLRHNHSRLLPIETSDNFVQFFPVSRITSVDVLAGAKEIEQSIQDFYHQQQEEERKMAQERMASEVGRVVGSSLCYPNAAGGII